MRPRTAGWAWAQALAVGAALFGRPHAAAEKLLETALRVARARPYQA